MPDLPTFNAPDTTAQRITAAFDGFTDESGSALPPATAYRRWLRMQIINFVAAREVEFDADARAAQLDGEMPL